MCNGDAFFDAFKGSAPLSNNSNTTSKLPVKTARNRGVTPVKSASLTIDLSMINNKPTVFIGFEPVIAECKGVPFSHL